MAEEFRKEYTIEEVLPKMKRKGEVLGVVRMPHPQDHFLFLVIIKQEDGQVVWMYNAQTDGFADGNYFKEAFSEEEKPFYAAYAFANRLEMKCGDLGAQIKKRA